MKSKAVKACLGASALIVSILALPVAAFVNWGLGVFLLMVPIYLVYRAQ